MFARPGTFARMRRAPFAAWKERLEELQVARPAVWRQTPGAVGEGRRYPSCTPAQVGSRRHKVQVVAPTRTADQGVEQAEHSSSQQRPDAERALTDAVLRLVDSSDEFEQVEHDGSRHVGCEWPFGGHSPCGPGVGRALAQRPATRPAGQGTRRIIDLSCGLAFWVNLHQSVRLLDESVWSVRIDAALSAQQLKGANMSKLVNLAMGLTTALVLAPCAQAGITFSSTPYDSAPAAGQSIIADFDTAPAQGFSFTGGGVYQGLTPNVAAPPAGDTTQYEAVLGGQSALLTSAADLTSLSLYIGSIDTYNTVTFSGNNGFSESFTGSELYQPANGNQSAADTNRRFNFNFGGEAVNKVAFSSSQNSFEFDNIAAEVVSAAPEPGVWALMFAGVAMLGMVLRVRPRRHTVAIGA